MSVFFLSRPGFFRPMLLLRADRDGVLLDPGRREEFYPWGEIDKLFVSRRLPRTVELVLQAKNGETRRLLIVQQHSSTKGPGFSCYFALTDDEQQPSVWEMLAVNEHLRNGRFLSSLLSVRDHVRPSADPETQRARG